MMQLLDSINCEYGGGFQNVEQCMLNSVKYLIVRGEDTTVSKLKIFNDVSNF